jgi:hypothetical protein
MRQVKKNRGGLQVRNVSLHSRATTSLHVTFCNKFRTSHAQHQLNITTAQLDFKFMRLTFDFGYTNQSLRTAFRAEMLHHRVHRISVRTCPSEQSRISDGFRMDNLHYRVHRISVHTCPSEQSRISDDFRMDNLQRLGKS